MVKELFRHSGAYIERTVEMGNVVSLTSITQLSHYQQPSAPHHAWWQNFLRGAPVVGDSRSTLRSVDLFSGVGGLSLGATAAAEALGFRLKHSLAVDLDESALNVYRHNFENAHVSRLNLSGATDYHVYGRGESAQLAYPPEFLESELEKRVGSVDLMLAGPPCQGHSSLNNHTRSNDPRNQLYVAAVVAGIALKARMIVVENVPAVANDRTAVVATARALLLDSGYYVSQGVLNASTLGGAQTRRRHFTIATEKPHIPLAEVATALSKPAMTLRDVIGDLEDLQSDSFMDEVPILSSRNVERINFLFDNNLYELPNQIRPDSHKDGHTYPSVYGRLSWEEPAPTITTGFMTPGRGRYIHPSRRRVITAREAARIQGFPDSFSFCEAERKRSRKLLSKWIGDAVPAQLGYTAVLTALSSLRVRYGQGAPRFSPSNNGEGAPEELKP